MICGREKREEGLRHAIAMLLFVYHSFVSYIGFPPNVCYYMFPIYLLFVSPSVCLFCVLILMIP